MRKACTLASALWFLMGAVGTAGAATMNFDGTLTVRISSVPPATFTSAGVATLNGSSGLGHLSTLRFPGGIGGNATLPLTDPGITPTILTVTVMAQVQSGTLAPISGGGPLTQNTMPIAGKAKICSLFANCSVHVTIPLTMNGTAGLGLGGTVAGGLATTLQGAPWTVGPFTIALTTTTSMATGFAHGPASASSTAQIGGVVQLVSPMLIVSGFSTPIPGFSVLTLRFVPEPGVLLLLASGVAFLAILARRRMGA